ncbi:PREDICTED: uncharacterized protein C1orf106 homolog, partial [Mesitornis unicolor]|uniref:uncharacterized protein C1orf106 homolog n=1 Tax=Mesitornis unicolor TaxID=54374 RepID=UPI0005286568
EVQQLGPATPPGSSSPEEPPEEEGLGSPPPPTGPWRETSLDGPYEKAKNPGGDPRDEDTRGSQCYPGSPLITPDPSASPRVGDVPPYRFVPVRTLVLCSVSHATSPGSSSPDVSFPRPPLPPPLTEPNYYPRGVHRFLPSPGPPNFFYEQDLAPLRYQRLVASHSRIVRTPSLKDYAPVGGRGLSKAAVTEELKSWHQRARLRGAPPHSLDREGPWGRTMVLGRVGCGHPWVLYPTQAPPLHVLRRSADGVPVQVYVPENGEIITQG